MAAGRVAVDRAEVALAVDQRVAQGEILRHARHRVVDGAIAVRVILAEHLADDTGGLLVRRAGPEAHVVHGVQDAPLHRLQAIARIGQRARHDHAHGVIEVGPAHLLVNADRPHDPESIPPDGNLVIHSRPF